MKPVWRLIGAISVLAMVATGCGDDDGEPSAATSTTSTASSSTTEVPSDDGRFGPLGEQPSLVVTVPEAGPEAPTISTARVQGGTAIVVLPYYEDAGDTRPLLAVVDDDGSVRWSRSLDGEGGFIWSFDGGLLVGTDVIDPADGSLISSAAEHIGDRYIHDVEGAYALLGDPEMPGDEPVVAVDLLTGEEGPLPSDDGLQAGFDYGEDEGGLRAKDGDGDIVWTRTELRYPPLEGSYIVHDDETVVATVCTDMTPDYECTYKLLGIDLASGDDLWSQDGFFTVGEGGDGHVLIIGEDRVWRMLDMRTGEPVDGQEWRDPDAFYQGCCGEGQYRHTARFGDTVVVVDETEVRIWFPEARSHETKRVELS